MDIKCIIIRIVNITSLLCHYTLDHIISLACIIGFPLPVECNFPGSLDIIEVII